MLFSVYIISHVHFKNQFGEWMLGKTTCHLLILNINDIETLNHEIHMEFINRNTWGNRREKRSTLYWFWYSRL